MIVVDIEATGLDPKRNSIVSIGAVDFSNPENLFYEECRIWEGADISDEGIAVCGFTREQVQDPKKPSLEEMLGRFKEWYLKIEERTISGQNPGSLDIPILQFSLDKYNLGIKLGHRGFDLHSLCYGLCMKNMIVIPTKEGRSDLDLDNILKFVGLPEEATPHNALTGAKLEAEAFSRLIYGKGFFEEFSTYEIPQRILDLE